MKSNSWNLYVAGVGSIDAASDMLTRFVGKLRDLGLKITNVQVIDGTYHPDLAGLEQNTGENGWTMFAYGEGDVSIAYNELPTFLTDFKKAGLDVITSGVGEGALRDVPIPA